MNTNGIKWIKHQHYLKLGSTLSIGIIVKSVANLKKNKPSIGQFLEPHQRDRTNITSIKSL